MRRWFVIIPLSGIDTTKPYPTIDWPLVLSDSRRHEQNDDVDHHNDIERRYEPGTLFVASIPLLPLTEISEDSLQEYSFVPSEVEPLIQQLRFRSSSSPHVAGKNIDTSQ